MGTGISLLLFLALITVFAGWRVLGRCGLLLGLALGVTIMALQWPQIISWFAGGIGLALILILLLALGAAAILVACNARVGAYLGLGRVFPVLGVAMGLVASVGVALFLFINSYGLGSYLPRLGDSTATQMVERFGSIRGEVVSGNISSRGEIWGTSWRLIKDRPWVAFEDLRLSWLRPLIGYGPDMFRYTFLLESTPRLGKLPMEPDHAHNFFINQTVEQGVLGLLASVGIFLVPMSVGVYLLLRCRKTYSPTHLVLLIGLLSLLAGRSLEQMVGLARISDLTIFWVLLAAFVVLPKVMRTAEGSPESAPVAGIVSPGIVSPQGRRSRRRARKVFQRDSLDWKWVVRFMFIALLTGGILTVTWIKTINYPRAAVAAGQAVADFQESNYRRALAGLDRAIELAPDVVVYYTHQANAYAAFLRNPSGPRESECGIQTTMTSYETCLVQKTYLYNWAGTEQRPLYWRARLALANSALALGANDNAIRLYTEVVDLVPASWPLKNRLAEAYMDTGRAGEALLVLEESLAITKDTQYSKRARQLQEQANQQLEAQR